MEKLYLPRYYKTKLLTYAEDKFRIILDNAIKEQLKHIDENIVILTKVRLLDIFRPNNQRKDSNTLFNKVSQKHIDFVIVDDKYNIICLVELDDNTHNSEERQERDKFVDGVAKECGVPIFRIKERVASITLDNLEPIIASILEHFAPTCEFCNKKMIAKRSHRGFNYGHWFYGCTNFSTEINCKYNISIG